MLLKDTIVSPETHDGWKLNAIYCLSLAATPTARAILSGWPFIRLLIAMV